MTDEHRKSVTSYPAAMLDFFGKNGKETVDFMKELKALSDPEKFEFREMLKEQGYSV